MSRLDKAPRGLPGPLGLVTPPANVPIGGASPEQRDRATQAYVAAGVELPAALEVPKPVEQPRRKKKVGGWNDYEENYERIRRAWYWTQTTPGGFPSMSDMISTLLLRQAEEWEAEHNGGEPFPDTGKVRHSRRT